MTVIAQFSTLVSCYKDHQCLKFVKYTDFETVLLLFFVTLILPRLQINNV